MQARSIFPHKRAIRPRADLRPKNRSKADLAPTAEPDGERLQLQSVASQSPKPVSKDAMRKAMSGWPCGVAVITVGDEASGELHGMTVNSLSSLSLDPPLISFNTRPQSRTLQMAEEKGFFAVNILGSDQVEACWNFCTNQWDRFEGVESQPGAQTGIPLLDNAVGHLECQLFQVVQVTDDRVLVLGQVVSADSDEGGDPLVGFRGQMRGLAGPSEVA